MSGKSKYCTTGAAVLVVLLVLVQSVDFTGGGPTRASGTDIVIDSITTHTDGDLITMSTQTISALVRNNGTIDHLDPVAITLEIYYPANESIMSLVHTDTVDLNLTLSWVGNQTVVSFPGWIPLLEGYYAMNISTDTMDDHPGNNSLNITVRATSGDPVAVSITADPWSKVMDPGESTKDLGNSPYRFYVTNEGIDPDTFTIKITSQWAMDPLPTSTGVLLPGERSDAMIVHVEVPIDAEPDFDMDLMIFEAISTNDPTISDHVTVNTSLINYFDVDVRVTSEKTQVAYPGGEWVKFRFLVTNIGTAADDYTLTVESRPTNWYAQFSTGSNKMYISLDFDISRSVEVWLKIPDLDYENMDRDNTFRNSKGAVVLTARGGSLVSDSDEGIVIVGLVHTVDLDITPENQTYEWSPDTSPTELRSFNFTVDITSINNIRDSLGLDMDVNLSLPEGVYGVLYTPRWDPTGPNETQSRKWKAAISPKTLHLESGESFGATLRITAPRFPFQGTAVSLIEAAPQLGEGIDGLALPAREVAEVIVGPHIEYNVDPPRTELYPEIMNGSVPLDENNNGRPDWQEGAPGDLIRLPFNITNIGNTDDFYFIDVDVAPVEPADTFPNDWELFYKTESDSTLPFWYDPEGDDHWTNHMIITRVPHGAPIGEKVNLTVRVTSALSRDERYDGPPVEPVYASITIYVIQGFALDLEPEENALEAAPDETVEYYMNITNNGNGIDTVMFITIVPDLKGWSVDFEYNDIDLQPLETRTLRVLVTPSRDASANDVLDIMIRAQSRLSPSTFDDVWINTTVEYVGGVYMEVLSASPLIWRYPGEIATFRIEVRNTGNGNDSFEISLDLGSNSWAGSIDLGMQGGGESVIIDIAQGQSKSFNVNISLPSLLQAEDRDDLEELDILAGTKIGSILTATPRNFPTISETTELTVGVLQQYKADLKLSPLETTMNKEVLVGEQVSFRMLLTNRGNGDDDLVVIHSSPTGSIRHTSWSSIDFGPHSLSPFDPIQLELTIEPYADDAPSYGERIDIMVEAMAGNNITYRKLNVSATVVMTRMISSTTEIDLGTTGSVMVRICNMPDPGETVVPGFTLQKLYNISTSVDLDSSTGSGWKVERPYLDITMVEPYQLTDLPIPLTAPDHLMTSSERATIDVTIRGYGVSGKEETRTTSALAVYFDASIDLDATRFENLYEGRMAKAIITMHATGTRGQSVIPVLVKVDGEEIGRYDAGPADPQDLSSGSVQEIQFIVEFELPSLKWYEKGKDLELEVIIDPDDQVVENTRSGRALAETNNVLKSEFLIKNYSPHWAILVLLGLLLLIAALAGVLGFFYLDKKNSWFLLPLSVGLVGLFSMLFYVPVETTSDDLGMANTYGLMIIIIDLVVIVPIMIYLYTRSGDGYILHLINKRRKREIVEGQEVTSSLLKPLLISLIGGICIILVPALFWVLPSEMNGGIGAILDAFFSMDAGFPVWVLLLLIPSVAIGLQILLIQLKKGALKGIENTWESLEGLRAEIKEGFQ